MRRMSLLYEIRFSAAAANICGERCNFFQRPLKDLSALAENSRGQLTLPAKHVSMPDLTRFIAPLNTLRFLSPLPSIPNLLMVIRYRTTMRCHRHHTKVASYFNGWEDDTQKESVPLGTQYRSQEHVAYLRHAFPSPFLFQPLKRLATISCAYGTFNHICHSIQVVVIDG